jgi:hypothetical protein
MIGIAFDNKQKIKTQKQRSYAHKKYQAVNQKAIEI